MEAGGEANRPAGLVNVPERPDRGATGASDGFALGRRELLLIFAFWTFFGLLTAANWLLDPRGATVSFSPPVVARAFLESYLWALLTPPIFWLSSRYSVERGSRLTRGVLFLLLGIVLALAVDLVVEVVRARFFPLPRRRPGGQGPTILAIVRLRFLNELIVYGAVLATGIARDYFLRYRARQEESVRLEAHAAHLQAQLAESRLEVLRTQLNPHFLFNTLHAVATLVERDPRGVRRMIARLSELLRYTLDGTTAQEIPLAEELELLRRYVEIMQIRFQGRLRATIDVSPDVEGALVPNLILQPLVENAMKHGAAQGDGEGEGEGRIDIRAVRAGDNLVLSVRDEGSGRERPAREGGMPPSPGVGLRNTRARLEQLYGAQQHFSLRPEAGGTVAEIVLPYHTASDLRAAVVPAES